MPPTRLLSSLRREERRRKVRDRSPAAGLASSFANNSFGASSARITFFQNQTRQQRCRFQSSFSKYLLSRPRSPNLIPPETRSKAEKITAPRLLSKSQIFGSRVPDSPKNVGDLTIKAEKTLETDGEPRSSDSPETPLDAGWNVVGAKLGGGRRRSARRDSDR